MNNDIESRNAHGPQPWRCTRAVNHDGPCALVPRWWNIRGRIWMHR